MKKFKMVFFRTAFLFVAVSLFVILEGCRRSVVPFDVVDEQYRVKPGALAVLSGNNSDFDFRLADALTKKLSQKSILKLMTQEDIIRRIPNYPSDIVSSGSADTAIDSAPYSFSRRDKARLDAIHAQLNTDYVLVIWSNNLAKVTSINTGCLMVNYSYSGSFYTRLFEYPSGKVVGYSSFGATHRTGAAFPTSQTGDDEKNVTVLIDYAVQLITDDFIKTTKTGKSSKGKK